MEAPVRKLLIALSLAGIFVLVADTASARPRGMSFRSTSTSKPVATQGRQRRDAGTEKDRRASSPPKSWVVAMPPRTYRPPRERSDAEAYAVSSGDASSDAPLAAASMPGEAAAAPPPAPKAPEPAAKAPEPQKPVRMVVLNPDPPRKPPAAGAKLPHHFAVCFFDQGGHCIAH
jgi:hypothetical protein